MKVVLDTNVLVSGLLNPFGPPAEIVRMTSDGVLEPCYDARILTEYRVALLRAKFRFRQSDVEGLFEFIKGRGHSDSSRSPGVALPDPDDHAFLEVALAGRASRLITGNMRHYAPYRGKDVKLVSPVEFLKIYEERS